jgi:glycosyltransferase involved in cell wall biosynthesis
MFCENPNEYEFITRKSNIMVFMGRILREKGVLHAIEIAEKTNRKLIIAGPIKDQALFRKEIMPRIQNNPKYYIRRPCRGQKKTKAAQIRGLSLISYSLGRTLWACYD